VYDKDDLSIRLYMGGDEVESQIISNDEDDYDIDYEK